MEVLSDGKEDATMYIRNLKRVVYEMKDSVTRCLRPKCADGEETNAARVDEDA